MRLDKFVGKAAVNLAIYVQDWQTQQELFYIPGGEYYLRYKEEMKHYKVKYYEIKSNKLYISAKKKED